MVTALAMDSRRRSEMKKLFTRLVRETEGQDLIEYALLAATIALGVTVAMQAVRTALQTQFTSIGTSITAGS
jgi:Flp pilus assembly pilin Flp